MIKFLWPAVFVLLPLPWLVRLVWRPAPVRRAGALKVPFFKDLAELPLPRFSGTFRRGVIHGCMALGWICLLTAVANPRWAGPPSPMETEGRDLLVAPDISGSMGLEDFRLESKPVSRLEVVKKVASRFISRRPGDRIGLILFGTRPYLQAPLTFDHETLKTWLDEAQNGLAGQQTSIGDAVGLAAKTLKDRPKRSRVLILMTDGANTAGNTDPYQAVRLARAVGMRIFAIGLGAEEMSVLTRRGRMVLKPTGRLDEKLLRTLAEKTGGQYWRAQETNTLQSIYREIDRMEPATDVPRFVRPVRMLFMWPLGAALLFSVLAGLIRAGAFRRREAA